MFRLVSTLEPSGKGSIAHLRVHRVLPFDHAIWHTIQHGDAEWIEHNFHGCMVWFYDVGVVDQHYYISLLTVSGFYKMLLLQDKATDSYPVRRGLLATPCRLFSARIPLPRLGGENVSFVSLLVRSSFL